MRPHPTWETTPELKGFRIGNSIAIQFGNGLGKVPLDLQGYIGY